jgi:hypothetical protein
MNTRIVMLLTALVLFSLIWCSAVFPKELSETKTIAFNKNVVVRRYKEGEVQAEPYTVKKGDNLWKIIINNYGIKKRLFPFFCRITKSLNPDLKNAYEIFPNQILLIPFKYVTHFNSAKEEIKSVLFGNLFSLPSQMPTEEHTILEGEQVAQILKDKYNIPGNLIFDEYLDLVKQLNPDVKDINRVVANQKVILPAPTYYQLPSGGKDELGRATTKEPTVERPRGEEAPDVEEVEEDLSAGKVQAKEISPGRMLSVEKEIEPVYVDPRFRKIAKHVPRSRKLATQYMRAIADVLQGTLMGSDKFAIPLMSEGQITIDTHNFPILQLTDKKKMILNYDNSLPSGLVELIQSARNDFEVVTLNRFEDIASVLDKIIDSAGYFSIDKSQSPLMIGNQIQFEIRGNWIIYRNELLKDITVVNLLKNEAEPIDAQLKDYIYTYGINLVDLYLMGDGEQEKTSFPPKAVEHKYHPEDVSAIDASGCALLVDSLLVLLGQDFKKDFMIRLFQGTSNGFDVEVMANRYFEREEKGYIISFHPIPEKLREVIAQQGNHLLNLPLPVEDASVAIKSVCDFLGINYDSPRPRFSISSNGEKKTELIIPGILVRKDEETRILITSLKLDTEVHKWLMAKRIKVVRLETSTDS